MESDVRSLILEQCGLAHCNLRAPPILLYAALSLKHYGDFFSDQYERKAIQTLLRRFHESCTWSIRDLLGRFE